MPLSVRMPVMAAKAAAPISAAALKFVRDIFAEARQLPLNVLAARLSSNSGLLVGLLPYRQSEVTARFPALGVSLERVPHEEDEH